MEAVLNIEANEEEVIEETVTKEIYGLKINNFKDTFKSAAIIHSLEHMAKIIKFQCSNGDEHIEAFVNMDKQALDNRLSSTKFYVYVKQKEIEFGLFDTETKQIKHDLDFEDLYLLTNAKISNMTDRLKSNIEMFHENGFSLYGLEVFNEKKKVENFVSDSTKMADEMFKKVVSASTDPRLSDLRVVGLLDKLKQKDATTFIHSVRVANYLKKTCATLGYSPEEIDDIYIAGLLHDCGKINIPSEILNKNGKLTSEERNKMESHSDEGRRIISQLMEAGVPGLQSALMMTKYHHTNQIDSIYNKIINNHPKFKTIMEVAAICDQFDAMTERRQYKDYKHIDDVMEALDYNSSKGELSAETLQKIADVLFEMSWKNEIRIEKKIKEDSMPGYEQQKNSKSFANERNKRTQLAKEILLRMKQKTQANSNKQILK